MESNITYSIIIGIVSSLFATGIFISLGELFRRVLIPWYQDKVYRGLRIDGEWNLTEIKERKLSNNSEMSFKLKQSGENIIGKYIIKSKDGVIDEYVLTGRLRDMYFLATAVPESKRIVDGASILMHLDYKNSQLIMLGSVLYKAEPGIVGSTNNLKFCWKSS